MGFRFSKRIKICKGVSVNLSKSGIGMSAGMRGFRVSTGPSGSYMTSSIPGTGISSRTKIGGAPTSRGPTSNSAPGYIGAYSLKFDNDTGKIDIVDSNGYSVDESAARRIKRTQEYKDSIADIYQQALKTFEENEAVFTEIYKATPYIVDEAYLRTQIDELTPIDYVKMDFTELEPTLEACRLIAEKKASVHSKIIWLLLVDGKKNYLNKRTPIAYKKECERWIGEKAKFEALEENRCLKTEKINSENLEKKTDIENRVQGEKSYILNKLASIYSEITLPVEFFVDADYNEAYQILYLDIDLPEIEDMPQKKANELSSGKVSVKKKTAKEIKNDYARCVTGMAFYLAGLAFNISPKIEKIVASGYTQRVSGKTGNIKDDYVYSVVFERNKFSELTPHDINPIEAIAKFENKYNITSTFELKTIEPFQLAT
jgi:hypothetical protein